ncbi:hypothetical protein [Croceicoccus mobilis]|uniref:Uncharacterized protein n=1 Tax=Croceicoccus mobilis TaxID=1703339 RepID=A0A916YZK9_9SPHN|nr:hypothetical protein [Croceicoccus mobilis]GGD68172.1 hypothetical protein GCM10010990_17130 [Croceicoccus mobilis]
MAKRRSVKKKSGDNMAGISPNPMTNIILADIALRGVSRVARRLTEQKLLSTRYTKEEAKKVVDGRSLASTLMATAVARVATRSVPGMVVVGGGMLAKALYDRRQGRRARVEGREEVRKRMANAEE